jgi:electron transfer flavoprotein alpha subunit
VKWWEGNSDFSIVHGMPDNKNIWVLAEYQEGRLLDVTLEMIGDARSLADSQKQKVCVLVLGGREIPDFSPELASYGADTVMVGRHELLASYQTEVFVQVLTRMCQEYQPATLIIGATPNGQDLASRLAARLGVGLVTYCLRLQVGVDGVIIAVKEAYGRKAYATLTVCGPGPHIFTFKPGAVGVGSPQPKRRATVIDLSLKLDEIGQKTRRIEFIHADPRTIDLSEADLVVAGGRGVGIAECFANLQALADVLGASIGGTRPAVDLGWIPFERQIGQTGKTISPQLYIAAGISGASLHTMGIKDSETIVAINTDQTAPIFKLAHLSAKGDLRLVVPLLIEKIKKHRAEKKT